MPESDNLDEPQLNENMLAAMVDAALSGHALDPWQRVEDQRGYQAACRRCGQTIYASDRARYSLLEAVCPGGASI